MTPQHPPFRLEAFAAFRKLSAATGESGTSLRRWLAAEIGIDNRHCILADMDATECLTVTTICEERLARIEKRRAKVRA